jgi:ribosome biogenesis GTPase / thiamine phosphate phosphatase
MRVEAGEFDVDETEHERSARSFEVPFQYDGLSFRFACEDAVRGAGAAEGTCEPRQGLRRAGGNCKGDDRPIEYRRPRCVHQCRSARLAGAFDQAVRAPVPGDALPCDASAVLPDACFCGGNLGVVGGGLVAKGEGGHGGYGVYSLVRRSALAIIVTNGLHRALVVSTGKNAAWVCLDGETRPRLAQLRRQTGKRFMPVSGDVVFVRVLEDDKTVVDRIEPRQFTLQRRSLGGREKTMAANVDTLVTVTALADPAPRLITLDQLLAFAELESIGAMVVLTKPDRADPAFTSALRALYERLDYRVLVLNPKTGTHVDELFTALEGRHALLCGNSGVGKSSIFRALGGEGMIGEVSRHGMGRQTTTAARLVRLPSGFLIDSPGVNEFGLGRITPSDLVPGFREMPEPATRCRFTDCTHLVEPGCGVQAAVAEGRIAPSRYQSYKSLLASP